MTQLPPRPLPPYSGNLAINCRKCRSPRIRYSYRADTPKLTWGLAGDLAEINTMAGSLGQECMLATCDHCGWAWLEQCADAVPMAVDGLTGTHGDL